MPRILSNATLQESCEAVKEHEGNRRQAARFLGVAESTLKSHLEIAVRRKLVTERELEEWSTTKLLLGEAGVAQVKQTRLAKELADLKIENKQLREEQLSAEYIKRLIYDCEYVPKPPKWKTPKFTPNLTGVPTLFLSDLHWDEVVKPEQVNGVNAYNREIAIQRLQMCFTKATTLLFDHMNKPKYDYVNVCLGGDMISGSIHEELSETNDAPIAQSVLSILDHLVAGFTRLLDKFSKVNVECVVGNHGRWHRKMRAKNRAYESHEFYLYHFLARHFRQEPAIHFDIADGAFLPYRIYNTRYLLAHGDQAKGGSGIAGALSPLMLMDHRTRKRAMATDQPYDILLLGHWHQLMAVKGMRINGSGKGYDEWAMSMGFDYELPAQDLWVTHPDHHVTVEWPIYLAEASARY